MRPASRPIGLAVIGAGRIGTHRARLAAMHPGVEYLAVADIDAERAAALASTTDADIHTTDWQAAISDARVNAVVVSTPEHAHHAATVAALRQGKSVLVEKPLALTLDEAAQVTRLSASLAVELRVGYSQRFKREHFLARHELAKGSLGQVSAIMARVYNTRSTALAILERSPTTTPVVDILTYLIDLVSWFFDAAPVEVTAKASGTWFKRQGHEAVDDATWCMLRFPSGALAVLGVSYVLPAEHPTQGQGIRVELVGDEGSLVLDEDHHGDLLLTERGYDHAYVPGHRQQAVYLGTRSPGDWALGSMFGPLADETRSWLDHLSTGVADHLATAEEAYRTLAVTLAIEEAVRTGTPQVPADLDPVGPSAG